MRNRLFAAFVVSAFAFGSANAAVIGSDTFDYADGALVPNGGWANHSGTAGTMLVASTQVELQMDGSAPEDANLAFTPVAGSVYYALDFSVTAGAAIAGGDYEYFAHFKDATFGFRGRLDVVEATGGGDFTLGPVRRSDEEPSAPCWFRAPSYTAFGQKGGGYCDCREQA